MEIIECSFCEKRASDVPLIFSSEKKAGTYVCADCVSRMVDELNFRSIILPHKAHADSQGGKKLNGVEIVDAILERREEQSQRDLEVIKTALSGHSSADPTA